MEEFEKEPSNELIEGFSKLKLSSNRKKEPSARRLFNRERELKDPRLHIREVHDMLQKYSETEKKQFPTTERKKSAKVERRSSISAKIKASDEIIQIKQKVKEINSTKVRDRRKKETIERLQQKKLQEESNYVPRLIPTLTTSWYEPKYDLYTSKATTIQRRTDVDVAFQEINYQSTGFTIWKINKGSLFTIQNDLFSGCFSDECYLFYVAHSFGQIPGPNMISREIKNKPIIRYLHVWIGKKASQEIVQIAAAKALELNDYFEYSITQYREIQEYESSCFKSYFYVLRIFLGRHTPGRVNFSKRPKLFKLKGLHFWTLLEMEKISWKYFDSSSIFLLLTHNILFIWFGRAAIKGSKTSALEIAIDIQSTSKLKSICCVDDGYEMTLGETEKAIFHSYLNLDKRKISQTSNDFDNMILTTSNCKLYTMTMETSIKPCQFIENKEPPFIREYLDSNNAYLMDMQRLGLWIWCGKGVSRNLQAGAFKNARGFVKKEQYPNSTLIVKVVDGQEPIEFKHLFASWRSFEIIGKNNKMPLFNIGAEILQVRPWLAADYQLLDSGSGEIIVYRVRNETLTIVERKHIAYFFNFNCYVVRYISPNPLKPVYINYCWLGLKSTPEDRKFALKNINSNDQNVTFGATLAKVWQGYEPAHFLQLFHGGFTVYEGDGTNVFDTITGKPSNYLIEVQGTVTYNTKAIERPLSAESLNSNHCFVLKVQAQYYLWCGRYTTGDEREMAKELCLILHELIVEGNESEEFWTAIGDKLPYSTTKSITESEESVNPVLYSCVQFGDQILTEHIINFSQTSLKTDGLYLLDAFSVIYVWSGQSHDNEATEQALPELYLKCDVSRKSPKTTIIWTKQYFEPIIFTGFFRNWDAACWNTKKSYTSLREFVQGTTDYSKVVMASVFEFDSYEKYPVTMLIGSRIPHAVNPLKKELHLTHDDFVKIFKMNYVEFEELPLWKQQYLKKRVGLF